MQTLPKLIYDHVTVHQQLGRHLDAVRRRFLQQTTETWTSDLTPDMELMVPASFEWFNRCVLVYELCSKQDGFSRWGVKHPMTSADMIDRLASLMWRARFVFIYRNLYDVARSAKARRFRTCGEDFSRFPGQWRDHLIHVLETNSPRVLLIRYEELVTGPAPLIAQLDQFTGIRGMDRTVLKRKINTFSGRGEEGESASGYIEPQSLTDDENRLLRRQAGSALDRFGNRECATSPGSTVAR